MQINQKGFVLITVLLFLQCFALLSLYGLTNVKLMLKATFDDQKQFAYKQAGKQFLAALSRQTLSTATCRIPIAEPTWLASANQNWWQTKACRANYQEIQYYYVVETLGTYPCVLIAMPQGMQAAKFERITLLTTSSAWTPLVVMQATIASPDERTATCSQATRTIKQGSQMFREI